VPDFRSAEITHTWPEGTWVFWVINAPQQPWHPSPTTAPSSKVQACNTTLCPNPTPHQHHKYFHIIPFFAFWAKNLMKVRQEKWARECMSSRFSKVPNLRAHSHTKWMNSCQSSHPQWLRHRAPQKPSHQSLETYKTDSLLFDALTLQEKNPRTSINLNPWVRFLYIIRTYLVHKFWTAETRPRSCQSSHSEWANRVHIELLGHLSITLL
jgi:hypothetical protein